MNIDFELRTQFEQDLSNLLDGIEGEMKEDNKYNLIDETCQSLIKAIQLNKGNFLLIYVL
jgi:hypothetical protein